MGISDKERVPVVANHPNRSGLTDVSDATLRKANEDSLPAREGSGSKEINWLGGSYAGTDIVVVAHIYDDVGDDETFPLEEEVAESQRMAATIRRFLDNVKSVEIRGVAALRQRFNTEVDFVRGALPARPAGEDIYTNQEKPHPSFGPSYYIEFQKDPIRTLEQMRLDAAGLEKHSSERGDLLKKAQWLRQQSSTTLVLGSLQTISVQSHREKYAVRALGTNYAKSYTRGPRTIAGSMIFTVFEEHPLKKLIMAVASNKHNGSASRFRIYGEMEDEATLAIPDMLPPVDLTIVFANEYGNLSKKGIYGVEWVNDGVTFSIEDMLSEQVMNFVARDIDPMTSLGNTAEAKTEQALYQDHGTFSKDQKASDLLFTSKDAYDRYTTRLGVRRRLKNR